MATAGLLCCSEIKDADDMQKEVINISRDVSQTLQIYVYRSCEKKCRRYNKKREGDRNAGAHSRSLASKEVEPGLLLRMRGGSEVEGRPLETATALIHVSVAAPLSSFSPYLLVREP